MFGLRVPKGTTARTSRNITYYLDATPTHSYLKFLYKYPQGSYPYERLVTENAKRGVRDPEFELIDTGLFDEDRYFDIEVEYAKFTEEDMSRSGSGRPTAALTPRRLHLIPHLWFGTPGAGAPRFDPSAPRSLARVRTGKPT